MFMHKSGTVERKYLIFKDAVYLSLYNNVSIVNSLFLLTYSDYENILRFVYFLSRIYMKLMIICINLEIFQ